MTKAEIGTEAYYDDGFVQLYHGDSASIAHTLATGSVQTIVTSPPYFGLRDYGNDTQIGNEKTLDEYVNRLVNLFRVLRNVLADNGTLWLNLGDSYSNGGPKFDRSSKNLLGAPWRVAFALQDDGWILRSDIIWMKPNPMPESVGDRPTRSHEYIFLFAKSKRYYYDSESIKTIAKTGYNSRESKQPRFGGNKQNGGATYSGNEYVPNGMANKRDVWEVATAPFPGSHFAVYPPELIRPCILAGSARGETVLDPFSGSGTTGMVAVQEGRKYIGIDMNQEYLELSLRTRLARTNK